MKKMKALKILTGFTVGLAVCVAALFAFTIIAPDKTERKSADTELSQEQTAGVIIEEVNQAAASVKVPQKGEKSVSLYTEATESEDEYYDYYEEYSEEPEYGIASFGDSDEMSNEYIEEVPEAPAEETVETVDETWEDDTWEDETWEDDTWEDDTPEEDFEEPTTNVPDPILDGNLTEGNRIAAEIAKYAETFVGVLPYNWAHHSLDPNEGADCSGFTHALYAAFGYDWLSYNDYGQSQQGRSVLYEEWLPGDIMCYYGHVGIYVGDGWMVHCPEPGRYVEYASATYNDPFDVRRMIE